jgi:hypothetical protein
MKVSQVQLSSGMIGVSFFYFVAVFINKILHLLKDPARIIQLDTTVTTLKVEMKTNMQNDIDNIINNNNKTTLSVSSIKNILNLVKQMNLNKSKEKSSQVFSSFFFSMLNK